MLGRKRSRHKPGLVILLRREHPQLTRNKPPDHALPLDLRRLAAPPGLVLAHLWRSRTCSKLRQVLGGKQTWKCPPEWAAEEWLRARPHEALYLLCGEPPDLDQRAPPFQVPTHG